MKRKIRRIFAIATAAIAAAGGASAQVAPSNSSLFADIRANRVGDIITIHIVEYSQGKNQANTQTSKESKTSAGSSGEGVLKFIPLSGMSVSNEVNFNGAGATDRTGVLRAKMTARIKSIDANGNYLIEGVREVGVNSEQMLMSLTGTIRPEDIATDNSVMSYQIADAKITYKGTGHANSGQKPGLITRLFNWIF